MSRFGRLFFVIFFMAAVAMTVGGRSAHADPPSVTVTVTPGMTCWGLAVEFTGDGTRCSELYVANAAAIEAEARSRGMASSQNGWWLFAPGTAFTPGTTLQLPASWVQLKPPAAVVSRPDTVNASALETARQGDVDGNEAEGLPALAESISWARVFICALTELSRLLMVLIMAAALMAVLVTIPPFLRGIVILCRVLRGICYRQRSGTVTDNPRLHAQLYYYRRPCCCLRRPTCPVRISGARKWLFLTRTGWTDGFYISAALQELRLGWLREDLKKEGLTLADIGTCEEELSALLHRPCCLNINHYHHCHHCHHCHCAIVVCNDGSKDYC